MAGRLKSALRFAICLPALAWAQAGGDPTRPAIESRKDATEAAPSSGPVSSGLQSILRRRNARPAAIINGEYVELGGKLGEARLSEIGDGFVVLTGPGGYREVMTQTPGVEKKINKTKPEKGAATHREKARLPARKQP